MIRNLMDDTKWHCLYHNKKIFVNTIGQKIPTLGIKLPFKSENFEQKF